MAELPIVLVGYFFGVMSFAWTHAWIVVPVLVAAWLLLFVPSSTWASLRAAIVKPLRGIRVAPTARHRGEAVLNFR